MMVQNHRGGRRCGGFEYGLKSMLPSMSDNYDVCR